MALTSGSYAMGICEPGQGRNTAALSRTSHVPQGRLEGAGYKGSGRREDSKRDARIFNLRFVIQDVYINKEDNK